MSDTEYMRIRSWEKYQTFNKARPNWIKLHTSILDDYEYCRLPDTTKLFFVHLCIAAAQMDNHLPMDSAWLRKKLSMRKVDIAGLFKSGLVERCYDGVTAVTHPLHSRDREETETEKNVPTPSGAGEPSSKKRAKPRSIYPEDSSPYKLARWLRSKILETNPQAKVPPKTTTGLSGWAEDIDKMIRIDKRDPNEVGDVIAWAQKDDFWNSNILSGKKLRKHFDQMFIQSQKGN